jgi:DNA polymerase-1
MVKKTDRDTIQKAYEKTGHPFLRGLLIHSVSAKAVNTYLRKMAATGMLSCLWNMTGTETGRLSSEGPNMQNLPHRLARCIRAREGYRFVIGDYSQLELRIAAAMSKDRRMVAAFQDEGRDLHGELAEVVFGKNFTKEQRIQAKVGNFEILYFGGPNTLATILNLPIRTAQKMHSSHRQLHPGFHRWAKQTIDTAFQQGYAETYLGRRRQLWNLESDDPLLVEKARKQAVNTPIQGSGGDFTKIGMVVMPVDHIGGWIPLQVHDSIVIEVPERYTTEAEEMLKEYMVGAVPEELRDIVPFKVDTKVREWWED